MSMSNDELASMERRMWDLEKEIEAMESHDYPDAEIDKVERELQNLTKEYNAIRRPKV